MLPLIVSIVMWGLIIGIPVTIIRELRKNRSSGKTED